MGDVKTAFLRAPLQFPGKIIVLRPPRVLVTAGLASPEEFWLAEKAIYGLQAAPAAWSHHRDHQLPTTKVKSAGVDYRLTQSKGDMSVWLLRPEDSGHLDCDEQPLPPAAILGIYVDPNFLRPYLLT